MSRPFRFGVQVTRSDGAEGWASLARKVEDLGYDTLVIPDHFDDQFAPFPALTAAAGATTRLRVGTMVACNDFVHPAVLARDAATVDVLSGGRLELGLGAGWQTTDYTRTGIPMDTPSTRIERLEESLQVVRRLLSGDEVTFQGTHYRVDGLAGRPRPLQQPHPPLLVGGGGRRVLSLAARQADIVGVNVSLAAGEISPRMTPTMTAEATTRKVEWIRAAAGDRFDDLELSVLVFATVVTPDRDGVAAGIGAQFGLAAEQVLEVPHFLIGSEDELVETLRERRERYGISYPVLQGGMKALAPVVERLAGT